MKSFLARAGFALFCLLANLSARGQSHIVPPSYATTNGDATFLGPLTGGARTYQLLIHSNQLTAMVGSELTGLSFRSSTSTTTTWPSANLTYTNYDIYLSESVLPANRSFTFANNVVGVQRHVRAGTLTIASGSYPAGGPASFGPVITFDSAYLYNGGNLLLEIRHDGNSLNSSRAVNSIGTSNSLYTGGDLSACWASSYTATSTTTQGNAAVVKFEYSPPTTTPVTSVAVSTQGNVPPVITTNGGTLQMVATVLPAAANQNVTWSIVPGTGSASISATGLVTAQTDGTVWAKAVSVQNTAIMDSMMITLSNQVVPVTSLIVSTQGNVPPVITTNGGTLQMVATVIPVLANQNVTWSIVPGTGSASISATGLVTAQTNGTVWAKAVSVQNTAIMDSMMITLTNQVVPVTSVMVSTQGSVAPVITINGGTLQMVATVIPVLANQNVTWSIVPGTGTATISATGLVTAQTNGTVWAKAVSVQNTAIRDSMMITIAGQSVGISTVTVAEPFTILPNPVFSGQVTLRFEPGYVQGRSVRYQLFDAGGKCVIQGTLIEDATNIDVRGVAGGTYFLRLTGNGFAAQRALVIQE